jgi:Zn-dependent metalloprotease
LDIEKDSCKERHQNKDVHYRYNDGTNGLPIVNTAVIVYQYDTRKLKKENGRTQRIHQPQVVKVLTDQETVATDEYSRVHARHQVEELKVLVSNLIFVCFRFGSVPVEVCDCHLNRLNE